MLASVCSRRLLGSRIATARTFPPFILVLTSTHILGRLHDHDIRFDQQRLHIGYLRSPQQSGASPTRVTRKPKSRRFTPSLIIPLLPPSSIPSRLLPQSLRH